MSCMGWHSEFQPSPSNSQRPSNSLLLGTFGHYLQSPMPQRPVEWPPIGAVGSKSESFSSWQVPKNQMISWKGKFINILNFLGNSKSLCEKKMHVEPPGKVLHPDVGLMPKTSERTRQGPVLSGWKSPRTTSQTRDLQEISPILDSEIQSVSLVKQVSVTLWKQCFCENDLEPYAMRSSLDTLTISSH